MAATLIFTESIEGPYVVTPVGAGDLVVSWTAADPVNGNYFTWDAPKGDILFAWNTDYSVSHNFTLTSVEDSPFLRTGDITNYAIPAGTVMAFLLNTASGWGTPLGSVFNINFSADSALVQFAIIQLQ